MLVSLLLLAAHLPAAVPAATPAAGKDPPVRVWFNSDGNYARGDRAKVYAKSAEDAYLIVLRADGEGRVRVLFPLDPRDDQRITGDKKYELKGRGDREAFVADDSSGHGTVLAAISASPFKVDEFIKDGRWDVQALSVRPVREDAEAGLLELVQHMKGPDQPFDYDVATYVISEQFARDLYPYPYSGPGWWGYDPWWGYSPRARLGLWWTPRGWRHW